ncbi:MAG: MBOAT family O-acyltransferase [Eubacteriales bacterium]
MVFSSLTFLLLFLPAVLILYFAVPKSCKNAVLFLASLIFYAWGEPIYVVLMLFSTVLDYTCGRVVDRYRGTGRAKAGLLVSVLVNTGLLCLFKYSDLLIGTVNSIFGCHIPLLGLPLPIGISFYTFQTMSYTIDVYRNDAKVQKNIISFGAYVSLFPQLIAGPIVRYQTIAEQMDSRVHSVDKFGEGVKRFAVGLGKKVLLANNIGLLWDTVSKTDIGSLSTLSAWLGITAFAFQIYFDFSGYSDMAIGLGKIFGFDFPENFNYPYTSKSITEFWRRWHISLGTWFRDYIYIPLGGNRRGLAIQLRNIAIVWLLTGFWHGASWNYLLWGVYYGVLLIIEKFFLLKLLKKAPAVIGHIYTLFCTVIGWVLFAFEDMGQGIAFLKVLFGFGAELGGSAAIYRLLSYLPLLLICAVAATPLGASCYRKLSAKFNESALCTVDALGICGVVLMSAAYLISGSYNPFLYFRF